MSVYVKKIEELGWKDVKFCMAVSSLGGYSRKEGESWIHDRFIYILICFISVRLLKII